MSAIENVISALASTTGFSPKARGDTWTARCPAHDDRNPSLVVKEGSKGVVLYCHSGCNAESIVKSLGLEWGDLFDEPLSGPTGPMQQSKQIEAEYDYTDEDGNLLFQVLRYSPKGFSQRKPTANGGWEYRLGDVRRPLFHLPRVVTAVERGRWILLVEGEKDALGLEALGFVATTVPGGSGAWRLTDTAILKGAKVAIIPDNDDPGRKYAHQAADSLNGNAAFVTIVELPGLPPKGDASDWLRAGNTAPQLRELITSSPQYIPPQPEAPKSKPSVYQSEEAEREIIAAAILNPSILVDIATELTPSDFYTAKWQACWIAFLDLFGERGIIPDAISLADAARLQGVNITADELRTLQTSVAGVTEAHIDMVRRARAARDVIALCKQTLATVGSGGDPYDAIDDLTRIDQTVASFSRQPESVPLDDFIDASAEAAPWVVKGLVRKDTTCILIGGSGIGKALNLRSIAMTSAQGIHPFTHERMEPIRTMIVDAENSRFSISETASVLRGTLQTFTGVNYDPERCYIWHQPQGINLLRRTDRAALQREIAHFRPNLVIMGPLYDLFRRRERDSYEAAADSVLDVFDDLRIRYQFALLIEHHIPKEFLKSSTGIMLPADSMRFIQWPELGITLREDEDRGSLIVGRYRGDRIRTLWPDRIDRDRSWLVSGYYEHGYQVDW